MKRNRAAYATVASGDQRHLAFQLPAAAVFLSNRKGLGVHVFAMPRLFILFLRRRAAVAFVKIVFGLIPAHKSAPRLKGIATCSRSTIHAKELERACPGKTPHTIEMRHGSRKNRGLFAAGFTGRWENLLP
jgi:hypothetical protein